MAALPLRALPTCAPGLRQHSLPCSSSYQQHAAVLGSVLARPGCRRRAAAVSAAAAGLHSSPAAASSAVWPTHCRHCGWRSRGRTLQRCEASQDGRGGVPDAQQEAAAGGGGSGGAAADSWQRTLQRSDGWVVQAGRTVVGFLAGLGSAVWGSLAADVPSFLAALRATAGQLPALLSQLRYPGARLVARRTVQVLGVVALLLAYVVAVDTLCSQIPRGIHWAQTHPGWLRRAAGMLLAAARQQLAGAA